MLDALRTLPTESPPGADYPFVLMAGERRGVVTLPHGYGLRYCDSAPLGLQINRLTSSGHCDPFTKTPFQKYVPVHLRKRERVAQQVSA